MFSESNFFIIFGPCFYYILPSIHFLSAAFCLQRSENGKPGGFLYLCFPRKYLLSTKLFLGQQNEQRQNVHENDKEKKDNIMITTAT